MRRGHARSHRHLIAINSRQIITGHAELTDDDIDLMRDDLAKRGMDRDTPADDIRAFMTAMGEGFRDGAPMTAGQAATVILDGVKAKQWRILVGDDAVALDQAVRADPIGVYGETGGQSIGTIVAAVQADPPGI